MQRIIHIGDCLHQRLLSVHAKHTAERVIVIGAIVSFVLHLVFIGMVYAGLIRPEGGEYIKLLKNPISAIYTPFSFILIYEVYLLVYYLPKSITIYVGKQYEIITLIVIRRIFKDLANFELTANWFYVKEDVQLTLDILATLILFFLIYLFYRFNPRKSYAPDEPALLSAKMESFVKKKKIIALVLVLIFIVLAAYSFGHWIYASFFSVGQIVDNFVDVNTVFFDQFFIILILADVFLLLISLLNSDKFNKVIRNSGFIISTILIRLSFGAGGLLNTILIVAAVLVGVTILWIHNLYEENLSHYADWE